MDDLRDFRKLPRKAGALYLAIACAGGFSIGYVPQAVVVTGDGLATAEALLANLTVFRLGVVADVLVILFELALSAILFVLLFRVSPGLSTIALVSRLGMAVVMGVNLMIWVMPLGFLSDLPARSDEMMRYFEAHALGIYIWQLFFAVHLMALGAALLRTGYAPRVLAWGLLVGAFGYLGQGVAALLAVQVALVDMVNVVLLVIVTLAELGFALWLLLRGGRRVGVLAGA